VVEFTLYSFRRQYGSANESSDNESSEVWQLVQAISNNMRNIIRIIGNTSRDLGGVIGNTFRDLASVIGDMLDSIANFGIVVQTDSNATAGQIVSELPLYEVSSSCISLHLAYIFAVNYL
jgi:hypothetical protein